MRSFQTGKSLTVETTPIPGFLRIELPVHGDNRGWFKENWQREKMIALGLPDFHPVQNNISFNDEVGVTRGIHAEPWDKFVSVATGKVFGAWVDLREGPSFGTVYTCEIDPSVAVFVPKGVGNSYQTLEENTAYTYLVNDHWSPEAEYTFLNLADETVKIDWPIPLEEAIRSDKDLAHPRLADVIPFPQEQGGQAQGLRVLVTGSHGQLGSELMAQLPQAGFEVVGLDRPDIDISDEESISSFDWDSFDVIINAAAWTDVDGAETTEGRAQCWRDNAVGPSLLARMATEKDKLLIHVSTEYVFDGTQSPHSEEEVVSPLGVYAQSKAAGDLAVQTVPKHYIVRTCWLVGEGDNFVRTISGFAAEEKQIRVIDDQIGRLTFAVDLAAGIIHLLKSEAPYGIYNFSNQGKPQSWAEIAKIVYEELGLDSNLITPVTTDEYFSGNLASLRPLQSVLDLSKIESTGFVVPDAMDRMKEYLRDHR